MPIPVYDKFKAMTAAGVVANAENIAYDTANGEIKQSEINAHLFQGERYDPSANSGKGAWVSNTSAPTAATTDTLGSIKVANKRGGPVFAKTGGTEIDRFYGVELDANYKAFVHVPWEYNAIPTASKEELGGVKTGSNTGVVVGEDQVIKADFDTTDYSEVEDITAYGFSTTTVASPDVVNKIVTAKLNEAIYDVLNTPI